MNQPSEVTQLPGTDPDKATVRALSNSGKFLGEWKIRPGDTLTITFSSEYEQLAKALAEQVKILEERLKGTVAE